MSKLKEILEYEDLPSTFDFWVEYLLKNFNGKYCQLPKDLKRVRCQRIATEILTKKHLILKGE